MAARLSISKLGSAGAAHYCQGGFALRAVAHAVPHAVPCASCLVTLRPACETGKALPTPLESASSSKTAQRIACQPWSSTTFSVLEDPVQTVQSQREVLWHGPLRIPFLTGQHFCLERVCFAVPEVPELASPVLAELMSPAAPFPSRPLRSPSTGCLPITGVVCMVPHPLLALRSSGAVHPVQSARRPQKPACLRDVPSPTPTLQIMAR